MTIFLNHISKSISGKRILSDVSLSVGEGEVLGLLGPNGAGKSTLMKILTGLWQADEGEAQVCGIDMRRTPRNVAPFIGYLPENNPLYDDMYVREYLDFMAEIGGTPRRERHALVSSVIERVGLTPEASKKTGWLSKGYRQRVGLAQALLQNPRLLVLDEPTTGLDPNQLDGIRALIKELGRDRTVILSTHILQEVAQMCNRVVIIDHGRIKADTTDLGDLDNLFRTTTLPEGSDE